MRKLSMTMLAIALILFAIFDMVVCSLLMKDGLTGYIIATSLQCIIIIMLFVFRNRIEQIFESVETQKQ